MLFLDGRKLRRLLAHARGGLGVSAALLRLEPPLLELAHLILGGFESLRLHVQLLLHQPHVERECRELARLGMVTRRGDRLSRPSLVNAT